MILQLLFVLTAIIIGARLGGIGLGVMGGVGFRYTNLCIWLATYGTANRCNVNDCRRYFRSFLHASSRRT